MTISKETIQDIFTNFEKKTVLVIGDVMVDSYVWGDVERISPEAPVPILDCNKREDRLGGAANVVLNIKSLGAKPVTCAVIGDDITGDVFKRCMNENNLPLDALFVANNRPTTRKTRLIAAEQQLMRIDEEVTNCLSADLEKQFIAHTLQQLDAQSIDAIIFEDYDKGAISPALIEAVVAKANKKGIPTLVDPKKRNFLQYKNVTLFKPNFKELKEGLNLDIVKSDYNAINNAANYLITDMGQQYVLATLSELGVFIATESEYSVTPAVIRDIADVSGAGDTVISIASLCLSAKLPAKWIAAIANLGGGLVCEKVGVVPIEKNLLLDEVLKIID